MDDPTKGAVADIHGVRLHNRRWSWGGVYEDKSGILLFVWDNETKRRADGTLWVDLEAPQDDGKHGAKERHQHIEAIMAGSRAWALLGYRRMGSDGKAHWFINRQGASQLHRVVRIEIPGDDGIWWAQLQPPPVARAIPTYRRGGMV